ncbi:MAG: tannase/feruloyl esterase family alpha/beta hydrolase [Chloroflexi bacterium]|nr:tannase/feruloyl esterase family alpha/beta hydrolase [Chloroflexota bacterium]
MDLSERRARIAALSLPETSIDATEIVPAGPYSAMPAGMTEPVIIDLPEHCRVKLVVAPQINVEVWLPVDDWNGRFQGVGGGGLAGVISYSALAQAVRDGYATASTDTGHVGSMTGDALWAIGRPDLVADYGYRAVHEMTLKAKAVVEAFYGRPAHHSYWNGCSTGGRQGLMEAQRYPSDYDGILAGAPAINISVFHTGQVWAAQHTLVDPESYITEEQYAAVNRWVLDNWDARDGAADGVIENPRQVVIDYAAVKAAANLTDRQVETLRALYGGPVNTAGESVYPGLMPGGETQWGPVVAGPKPFPIGPAIYGQMVFEEPDWDWRGFNYDADVQTAVAKLRDVMDAIDPDLGPFQRRGGKLILFHGWSDFGISPEATRRYYEAVVQTLGGREAVEKFARLFLIPGMGHCRGGTGADRFEALGPLVEWVEHGVAPDHIVASRVVDGEVVRTRPLCAYPKVARWTGSGSIDDATNFKCVDPD